MVRYTEVSVYIVSMVRFTEASVYVDIVVARTLTRILDVCVFVPVIVQALS